MFLPFDLLTCDLQTWDFSICGLADLRLEAARNTDYICRYFHSRPQGSLVMSQTFVFEELDEATRDYLTRVRATKGEGAPGVFAPTGNIMAGCGCILGPIIIALTLALTLTDWIDLIYKDPVKVAFLQTAGLLVGGWLVFAGFRSMGTPKGVRNAGNWVYLDPLYLYEAYREQVKVTPVDDAVEANFTHNYNNGAYQNSVVRIQMENGQTLTISVNNEQRAEQMVVFVNYLAWARGPEGGDRAGLAPAALGGLARYVVENDVEPKDADNNINLNLVELDVDEVPEEPRREGRAAPNILPYIAMLGGAVGIFFVMGYVVNPPIRDEALFDLVITEQCQPWFLQMYLLDARNTKHRTAVQQRLAREYDEAIGKLQQNNNPGNQKLRDGMIQILRSLREVDRPTVSLRVTEVGGRAGAESRVKQLKEDLVGKLEGQKADPDSSEPDYFIARGGIYGELANLMPAITQIKGQPLVRPQTARGVQLIEFAEMPEDAEHAHFEIQYEFSPTNNGDTFWISGTVEVRTKLTDPPVVTYKSDLLGPYRENQFDQAVTRLKDEILAGLVGKGNMAMPGGFPPPPNFP